MTDNNLAGVIVLLGRGATAAELPIGRRPVIIGRDPWADVVVRHPAISRHHAMIWAEPGQLFVRDLGSSGGTWVGGRLLAAGESCEVSKRQTLGMGGALDFKFRLPRMPREGLPGAGRLVLEEVDGGWRALEAAGQAETTALSETRPGPDVHASPSTPDFLESLGELALDGTEEFEPPTEEDFPAVGSASSMSDEVPTARLQAMGDLLMGHPPDVDEFVATASAPALPPLPLEDPVEAPPQEAQSALRIDFRGKSVLVQETRSGNRTSVRGETRVALLRTLAVQSAGFVAGEQGTARVSDVALAGVLWPEEAGEAGPRIDLLIRRLQRQLREAGLPPDLVSRDREGTGLLTSCAVPDLPRA